MIDTRLYGWSCYEFDVELNFVSYPIKAIIIVFLFLLLLIFLSNRKCVSHWLIVLYTGVGQAKNGQAKVGFLRFRMYFFFFVYTEHSLRYPLQILHEAPIPSTTRNAIHFLVHEYRFSSKYEVKNFADSRLTPTPSQISGVKSRRYPREIVSRLRFASTVVFRLSHANLPGNCPYFFFFFFWLFYNFL